MPSCPLVIFAQLTYNSLSSKKLKEPTCTYSHQNMILRNQVTSECSFSEIRFMKCEVCLNEIMEEIYYNAYLPNFTNALFGIKVW